ncbi:hypothetical protein VSX64_14560 [Aurantimonas sp. C2-6-R+9]|uniref:hypothetical protein n=1 Tax=unclassified Aurantimonas TaxID=2638230 RepID=UPI002E19EBB7|nr:MULTISPECIES: hypothetical protein [unclassified Aurantimonas]MEC5291978.1 hypothetical protein [Aurantimonas sp. C2-3-R2]MEC5382090.1 hypothetical protein [Aurantimonas sp. C2-6-R+9]MEC5413063.1 hypothetical protein [Aurantimonas sp. C2-4-R8]
MRAMIAITGVRNGGKRVAPGKPFEVPGEIADELIALGSARDADPASEEAGEDGGANAEQTPEARASTIAAAVAKLSDTDWTAAGRPKVAAVEKATGLTDIAADELAAFRKDGQ